jgi:acid phosphatase type 7
MRFAVLALVTCTLACSSKEQAAAPSDAEGEIEDDEDTLPKCEAAVSKGPWVVAVDATHAKVRWESCQSGGGAISIAPETGGEKRRVVSNVREAIVTTTNLVPLRQQADPAGTYFMHEVALETLTEGTCYAYELETDSTAKGRFCTARASGETFSFALIGDTNPGFGQIQTLLETTYAQKPDFTIHNGDIQYYSSGLESYTYWMEQMRPMLRTGAFFPSIGNHESEQPMEREEYVDRFFGNAGFDGSSADFYYRFQSGGVWFFALNTEIDLGDKSQQGTWLQEQLRDAASQPGYRFSVLYMHRPFVTCGDKSQNSTLREIYKPLFESTNVKLVVAGHMHGYERFEFDGITWITSGGGGGGLGDVNEHADRTECASRESSGAFWDATVITVKPGEISGVTFDDKGATRDTFTSVVP